ncbi:MAG TPA: MarR family transcriptional regulator [Armatimonadota bacterium]|jgi:DNA-binding MarR family transcriptional regulator
MKPYKLSPEEASAQQLWEALLRASLSVRGEVRELFAQWNLTGAQWRVLMVLAAAPDEGLRQSEIGEQMLVTGGNVTGLIDRLEEAGLVCRQAHPDDRRVVLATLTPRGQKVYQELAPAFFGRLHRVFSGVPDSSREPLRIALGELTQNVQDNRAAGACSGSDPGGPGPTEREDVGPCGK